MSNKCYTEEIKVEAVTQITERGYLVTDVAQRLGVTTHRLYARIKKYGRGQRHVVQVDDRQAESKLR